MSLKCNNCGSRNTQTTTAKKLAETTGNSNITNAASGFVSPKEIVGLLKALFEWLSGKEKNSRSVVVCKDCGYWERV